MKWSFLLVDDNVHSKNLMNAVIKSMDAEFTCTCTETGSDFLKEMRKRDFDYYIIDYTLPDILGFELYKKLLKEKENPECFIVTAGPAMDIWDQFSTLRNSPIYISDRNDCVSFLKQKYEAEKQKEESEQYV